MALNGVPGSVMALNCIPKPSMVLHPQDPQDPHDPQDLQWCYILTILNIFKIPKIPKIPKILKIDMRKNSHDESFSRSSRGKILN